MSNAERVNELLTAHPRLAVATVKECLAIYADTFGETISADEFCQLRNAYCLAFVGTVTVTVDEP